MPPKAKPQQPKLQPKRQMPVHRQQALLASILKRMEPLTCVIKKTKTLQKAQLLLSLQAAPKLQVQARQVAKAQPAEQQNKLRFLINKTCRLISVGFFMSEK